MAVFRRNKKFKGNPYSERIDDEGDVISDYKGYMEAYDAMQADVNKCDMNWVDFLSKKNSYMDMEGDDSDFMKAGKNRYYSQMSTMLLMTMMRGTRQPHALLHAIGMYTALSFFAPEIKQELHKTVASAVLPYIERWAEKGGIRGAIFNKFQKAAHYGHMPWTPKTAALQEMAFLKQAYRDMRQPGADVDAISENVGKACLKLRRQALMDGIPGSLVDENLRKLVGVDCMVHPENARIYDGFMQGTIRKSDAKEIVYTEKDSATGQMVDYTKKVWSGEFEYKDGTPMTKGFGIRKPMSANQYSASIYKDLMDMYGVYARDNIIFDRKEEALEQVKQSFDAIFEEDFEKDNSRFIHDMTYDGYSTLTDELADIAKANNAFDKEGNIIKSKLDRKGKELFDRAHDLNDITLMEEFMAKRAERRRDHETVERYEMVDVYLNGRKKNFDNPAHETLPDYSGSKAKGFIKDYINDINSKNKSPEAEIRAGIFKELRSQSKAFREYSDKYMSVQAQKENSTALRRSLKLDIVNKWGDAKAFMASEDFKILARRAARTGVIDRDEINKNVEKLLKPGEEGTPVEDSHYTGLCVKALKKKLEDVVIPVDVKRELSILDDVDKNDKTVGSKFDRLMDAYRFEYLMAELKTKDDIKREKEIADAKAKGEIPYDYDAIDEALSKSESIRESIRDDMTKSKESISKDFAVMTALNNMEEEVVNSFGDYTYKKATEHVEALNRLSDTSHREDFEQRLQGEVDYVREGAKNDVGFDEWAYNKQIMVEIGPKYLSGEKLTSKEEALYVDASKFMARFEKHDKSGRLGKEYAKWDDKKRELDKDKKKLFDRYTDLDLNNVNKLYDFVKNGDMQGADKFIRDMRERGGCREFLTVIDKYWTCMQDDGIPGMEAVQTVFDMFDRIKNGSYVQKDEDFAKHLGDEYIGNPSPSNMKADYSAYEDI